MPVRVKLPAEFQPQWVRPVIDTREWLESGVYRIKATASQVTGKTLGFIESGVNVILAGTRERAQQIAERLIFISARRRYRELRGLVGDDAELPPEVPA